MDHRFLVYTLHDITLPLDCGSLPKSEVDAESAPRLTSNATWFDIVFSGQYFDLVAKAAKRLADWSQLWIHLDFVITIMAVKTAFFLPAFAGRYE